MAHSVVLHDLDLSGTETAWAHNHPLLWEDGNPDYYAELRDLPAEALAQVPEGYEVKFVGVFPSGSFNVYLRRHGEQESTKLLRVSKVSEEEGQHE